ncbi:MAG: hypothetical protein Q9160_005509 [Pyrenula sp. 1 TL-2023]
MSGTHGLNYAAGPGEKNRELWNFFEDSVAEQKASTNGSALLQAAFQGNDLLLKSLIKAGSNIAVKNDEGKSILHAAAMGGHARMVEYLLQAGVFDTTKDERGNLALHDAAFFGHASVVKILIKRTPALLGQFNLNGESPLYLAVRNDHEEAVSLLSGYGENIDGKIHDETDRGRSLVHALKKPHQKIAKKLLADIADNDITVDRAHLEEALRKASEFGFDEIVELLLNIGANVNPRLTSRTPLQRACVRGHEKVVKLLLAAGADIYERYSFFGALALASGQGSENLIEVLLAKGGSRIVSNEGDWAAQRASRKGHERVVELLIQAGIPSQKLNAALESASSEGHVKIVKSLLSAGAKPDGEEEWRTPPLHCATQNGHVETVQLLLYASADVNRAYNTERALEVASSKGHEEILRHLLKAGADIEQGRPLARASENGRINIVKLLLGAGADRNTLNVDDWQSAVEAALNNGHNDILELLSTACPKPDQDEALKLASRAGNANTVKLLLNTNARWNNVSPNGWRRALDFASEYGHVQTVRLLLDAGTDSDKGWYVFWNQSLALDKASKNGHGRVVELLLADHAFNFDINAALSVASANGHENVVELLFAASAGGHYQTQESEAMQT